LDAADGKPRWQVKTDLHIAGGPGYGEGLVLIGTSDAQVVALDASNGQERWRADVSSEVLSKPVAAQGVVVAHTVDGKLVGLDAATGAFRWQYDQQVPVLSLRGTGIPVVSGPTVICGLAGGRLVSLEIATGRSLWEVSITTPSGRSELERMVDIDGEPLVLDGTVYVATYQGQIAAVGEGTGRILWSKKMSSYNKVAIDWRRVYTTDADGSVLALGADSGDEVWRYDALRTRKLSAPAVFGGYVVTGDLEGYLHWFNSENGRPVARIRVGSDPIIADPVVLNGTLYVLGSGGELAAIRLDAHRRY
jgi:outer membrane protein assembly factor BamB